MNDYRGSFIELASPTFSPTFSPLDTHSNHPYAAFSPHETQPHSRTSPQSYSDEFSSRPHSSKKPLLAPLSTAAKPPVPTSAKPDFSSRRSRSAQRSLLEHQSPNTPSPSSSSPDYDRGQRHIPLTSNLLHPQERADLVRKTRKLTQLFGQTPGVGHFPVEVDLGHAHAQRTNMQRVVWPPAEDAQYVNMGMRRRSVPFSPQDLSPMSGLVGRDASHVIEIGRASAASRASSGSPESFIDLPDPVLSPSTPSLLGALSLDDEQRAEDDRRRKREKLAKLHRFLGSRVPTHLVLGPLHEGVPLPSPAPSTPQDDDMPGEDAEARRLRLRRRRSSSAAEFGATWSDEIDRLKGDLNEREKAINVRRAVKMEKMFGVAPPQVLYHTRQAVSSPGSSGLSPIAAKPRYSTQSSFPPPVQSAGPSGGRNLNQTSYKGKSKKGARPGTADSTEPLIDHTRTDTSESWEDGMLTAMSDVYMHYRHSLNSLNDIIDRDDKQSLAELHDYLSGRTQDTSDHTPTEDSVFSLAQAATTKAERRRSMPTRTSMASLASVSSEWTILPSPPPEESAFQQRRRRAAKLTQFFGVNYRDLMNDVLESIEKGLEEERGRGTLKPDEVQDLMQKLRRLKTKRNNWP
ncbi:uncharacterized protein B0H18DRAFT_1084065 [Fomitopsis serialis]|uniref:uncharacterized protein n=1 Tax=Fomitopsis serialis TaxID=139415 RepID=UPI0020076FD4|nr:uncharacterized protein B0H18DRAFT_1084065 [Neoantrodia serialis]KAH9929709.1 hypothetical protein B0H18DRAFT_1084065 [Neoantrodia serialis]